MYSWQIAGGLTVIILQTLLIVSRLVLAGELTGAIAHEINQPLGAILSNAGAAELILQGGGDRREDMLRVLADIRRGGLESGTKS